MLIYYNFPWRQRYTIAGGNHVNAGVVCFALFCIVVLLFLFLAAAAAAVYVVVILFLLLSIYFSPSVENRFEIQRNKSENMHDFENQISSCFRFVYTCACALYVSQFILFLFVIQNRTTGSAHTPNSHTFSVYIQIKTHIFSVCGLPFLSIIFFSSLDMNRIIN